MRLHVSTAILVGLFFSSFAIAQEPLSHFDISGNLSFNGASLPTASSSTTQVRAIGWQTTGVTRFNRWFALSSQFGSSTASADSMQLIGFTGPGTMRQYSALAGPRITIPTKGRFNPFVEGLVGADRASTSLVSNGTSVTGREVQLAYALGGGAQINLSRHFGLNFEAQYFDTQDSIAFTGWQPAHFQVAAGVVIRMFNRTPQIAEQHTSPTPDRESSKSVPPTVAENTQVLAPATNSATTVQAVSAVPPLPQPAQSQTTVASSVPVVSSQPAMIARSEPSPHVSSPADGQNMTAAVIPTTSQVVAPAAQPSGTGAQQPTTAAVVMRPAPVVTPTQANPSQPVQAFAQAPPPPVNASVAASDTTVQAEPVPISLGEYARRLREKKQQQQQNH